MHSAGSRLVSAVTASWGPRVLWLAVGVGGAWSIGDAVDGRTAAVRTTITIGGWVVWGVGVVALVVPSTLALTVMRMISALAGGAAVLSWAAGTPAASGATFLACTLICALLIGGADFGHRCVQASAYGDEQRFLLRPPAAFLPPILTAGLAWVAAVLAAPLLVSAGRWIIGAAVTIVAALLTWLLLPRFNVLSRRWLVLVPVGIVVHDRVVLAETLMVLQSEVAGIDLALAGTEAADFTGPAAGHAVEIGLRSMTTAILAPSKSNPRGIALHVQSFIVAPSRPGAVLRAIR